MADFFAHSGSPEATTDWQLLRDHLMAVASRAAENARPFGLDGLAHATGLLHDLGKYDPRFQQRLHGANIRVDHSTAGAWYLQSAVPPAYKTMAEIVGYEGLDRNSVAESVWRAASCRPLREGAYRKRTFSPTEESTAAPGVISCAANMKTSNLRWLVEGRGGPALERRTLRLHREGFR